MASTETRLVVVDGNNVCHRAYWATVQAGMTAGGEPSGALYGAINSLRTYVRELKPTHMLWCFDGGRSTFRTALRPEYKGHRKYASTAVAARPAEDLPPQIDAFRRFLDTCYIEHSSNPGVEADDLIARTVHLWSMEVDETVIISGDHDLLQLVRDAPRVRVLRPGVKPVTRGHGIRALKDRITCGRMVDTAAIFEEYGVEAHRLPEVWALTGDNGDNIAGIPGVGPKTAAKWINKYGNLAAVLRDEPKCRDHLRMVAENFDLIYLDGRIGDLSVGALRHLLMQAPSHEKVVDFLDHWEMKSLVEAVEREGLW